MTQMNTPQNSIFANFIPDGILRLVFHIMDRSGINYSFIGMTVFKQPSSKFNNNYYFENNVQQFQLVLK